MRRWLASILVPFALVAPCTTEVAHAADVRAVHALVAGPWGGTLASLAAPLARVVAATGGSLTLLAGDAANGPGLRAELQRIAERTEAGDLAIIHLGLDALVEGERTVLLASHAGSGATDPLAVAEIASLLAPIRGEVLLLLDTTMGSGFELAAARPVAWVGLRGDAQAPPPQPQVQVQALASRSVPVLDPRPVSSPVRAREAALTVALAEGLEGEADYDGDGRITGAELETWLAHRVRRATRGEATALSPGLAGLPTLPVGRP